MKHDLAHTHMTNTVEKKVRVCTNRPKPTIFPFSICSCLALHFPPLWGEQRKMSCYVLPPRGHSVENDTVNPGSVRTTLLRKSRGVFSSTLEWDLVEVAAVDDNALDSIIQSQERLREASAKRQTYGAVDAAVPTHAAHLSDEGIAQSMRLLDEILNPDSKLIAAYQVPPNVNHSNFVSISAAHPVEPVQVIGQPRPPTRIPSHVTAPNEQTAAQDGRSLRQTIGMRAQENANSSLSQPYTRPDQEELPSLQSLLLEEGEEEDDVFEQEREGGEEGGEGGGSATGVLPPPPPAAPREFMTEMDVLAARAAAGLLPPSTDASESIDAMLSRASAAGSLSTLPPAPRKSYKEQDAEPGRKSWAVTTLLDESIFDAMRPKLAVQYSFELDSFQKQAVMRLERKESVFVAAHTSAGKTVVAEYAIAMSQRHMSRTIYTSPIKALSNQKYRDFREKFGADVGLITGDVSVNPDAACLVMTTEILRSMLYRGSDVVRDIEWVIFDEVHYVNDAERGVVWEEVIIMLPEYINLIFLSATTPNTIEFCDWIGRTKRRKVYVTSTLKRPVPLQHFLLYDDEYYKLLSPETGFNVAAVAAAAKREKEKLKPKAMSAENSGMKSQRADEKLANAAAAMGKSVAAIKASGGGGSGGGSSAKTNSVAVKRVDVAGSKAQWLSLLRVLRGGGREAAGGIGGVNFGIGPARHEMDKAARLDREKFDKYERLPAEFRAVVSKKEYERLHVRAEEEEGLEPDEGALLPVVVFCFSKKKCEEIADHLGGQDLLTAREKNHVRRAICVVRQRLNPQDMRLPQLLRMEEMLMRGVGVHHGGLLPILKEATEMLFAKGVVKVLVATETFAMGVNMPARAVVFNGFRKHDGRAFRDLLPGEYTQMAGRAGRRGLDKVGTVIVAAWSELPAEVTVKQLLTGTATKLSSQFRLSYSMILNLLRVNDMSVEDMIKRSFSEFHTQRQITGHDIAVKLQKAEAALVRLERESASLSASSPADAELGEWEAADAVQERRRESSLLDEFQGLFACSQRCLQNQLRLLQATGKRPEMLQALSAGRVGWVQHACPQARRSSGCLSPCLGVILADPDTSASLVAAAAPASSLSSGLGIGGLGLPKASDKDKLAGGDRSGGGKGCEEVWALILLPGGTDVSGFTLMQTGHAWTEQLDSLDGRGWLYWLCRVPTSAFGVISAERLKLPAWTIEKRMGPMGLPAPSTPAQPSAQQLQAIALQLFALCVRVQSACPFIDLPSLAFVTSADAFPPARVLQPFDMPREFGKSAQGIESVEMQMKMNHCCRYEALAAFVLRDEGLQRRFHYALRVARLHTRIASYRHYASNANLALFPDYQQRLNILRMLEYVEQGGDTVTLKGRVACEMNTCNELVASEMIFSNVLEPLTPTETAAVLSALVFQEKFDDSTKLTSRMETAREQMKDILRVVTELQDAEGVSAGVSDDFKPALNFGIAAVIYQWARGVPFREITDMTLIHEGSIVRCITRLDELLKDVRNAARVIGNPSLYRKMIAASMCIRRDIVFAASLYV